MKLAQVHPGQHLVDQFGRGELVRAQNERPARLAGSGGREFPGHYPAIVKLWRAHWAEFAPFLAFPPEVRRVIYTTNLIVIWSR